MAEKVFAHAVDAALAGYSPRSGARVAAYAISDRAAAVLVVTPERDYSEYLVACVLEDDGWYDAGGGNADVQWDLVDDERDTGTLRGWGRSSAPAVQVSWAGRTTKVLVQDGYFAWVLQDVPCPGTLTVTDVW